jgi:hypothetical protein
VQKGAKTGEFGQFYAIFRAIMGEIRWISKTMPSVVYSQFQVIASSQEKIGGICAFFLAALCSTLASIRVQSWFIGSDARATRGEGHQNIGHANASTQVFRGCN